MATIKELLSLGIAFIGSDWVEDNTCTDGPFSGYRYNGEAVFINSNDLFCWGIADGERICNNDINFFNQCAIECDLNYHIAAMLFCCRRNKMRPQGAAYSFIPNELWYLFDKCGPEREIGTGNPYKPGEYIQ